MQPDDSATSPPPAGSGDGVRVLPLAEAGGRGEHGPEPHRWAVRVAWLELALWLAKQDGRIAADELVAIERFLRALNVPGSAINLLKRIANQVIQSGPNLEAALPLLRRALTRDVLEAGLHELAAAFANVSGGRRSRARALHRLAGWLGCDPLGVAPRFAVVLTRGSQWPAAVSVSADGAPGDAASPLAALRQLELQAGASIVEIRRSYRRLAIDSHPDRFVQQGPAAVAAAERRFQSLHAAYRLALHAARCVPEHPSSRP